MTACLYKNGGAPRILPALLACALVWLLPDHIVNAAETASSSVRTFAARGIVEEVQTNQNILVIRHEAVTNYMGAMTMPFKIREPALLTGISRGDQVSFQLHVTDSQSWIDQIRVLQSGLLPSAVAMTPPQASPPASPDSVWHLQFTNELGQAVTLGDYRGQALAITFFYTRCPLPDYCPRLSKNFAETSKKLLAMTNAPGNWHLFSVSFDPEFDTPPALKAYAEGYQYDAAHWSLLTGAPETIRRLARAAQATYEPDNGTINHNFRTLIIDQNGHLQMVFPTSGDLSDQIVDELLKACTSTQVVSSKK